MKKKITTEFEVFNSSDELESADKDLLDQARKITKKAYAPYSNFSVGAVALLNNGKLVKGTNQENASFPAGICAERVLLGNAAMQFTDQPIQAIAISYHNLNEGTHSNHPISPCGICRQTLAEYEQRTNQPIRIILSGMEGKVFILESASNLLPLGFGSKDMM